MFYVILMYCYIYVVKRTMMVCRILLYIWTSPIMNYVEQYPIHESHLPYITYVEHYFIYEPYVPWSVERPTIYMNLMYFVIEWRLLYFWTQRNVLEWMKYHYRISIVPLKFTIYTNYIGREQKKIEKKLKSKDNLTFLSE